MGVGSPRGREWEWRWGHLGVGSKSGGEVT